MPRYIVYHRGYFFEWSTIVDAPVTEAMLLEQFKDYYQEEYGNNGMEGLSNRLERAIKNGTSCYEKMSAEELIECNRAGEDEEELTFEEVLEQVGIPTKGE